MSRTASLIGLAASLCLSSSGCEGEDGAGDPVAEDGASESAGDSTGEGDAGEELDRDGDGLSDAQEAELGTDPLDVDSDDDNYWDSWELIEGTDPLDLDSRIYTSWWPYNPDKDELEQGHWATASTEPGSIFPRHLFYDRHGEHVDIYDFANFTVNPSGTPAHIIVDISAQWCGPCHSMAYWLGGTVSSSTQFYRDNYPSVPDKVHDLEVWWMTFVVEGGDKGAPDLADASTWFEIHPEPQIPVFADIEQIVHNHFGGSFYPFLFLLDPELKIVMWTDSQSASTSVLSYVEHEL